MKNILVFFISVFQINLTKIGYNFIKDVVNLFKIRVNLYLCGMLTHFLTEKIKHALGFEPTQEQNQLIDKLSGFILQGEAGKLFLLKGYAGTGKTTVVSALVKTLNSLKMKTVLLAPTGRAAKVISSYSGFPAYTIHKKIYRQKSMSEFKFQLMDNMHKDTLFIVDEASMISDTGFEQDFGSGRLLDDLIDYVYGGEGCSLLLLGDSAQLPPVMQENSPALELDKLRSYGLSITDFTLTQVVRQALESGILYNATQLRINMLENEVHKFPVVEFENFNDIRKISGMELIDEIQQSYQKTGIEETIVVTRSNYRANIYNQGIRSRVLMKEEELVNGDLLMVTKNNYFWSKPYDEIDFIANGDIVEVVRIRKQREMYGFRFADLTLRSLDYNWEIDARIWLDSLQSESPKATRDLNEKLFQTVAEDYAEYTQKRTRIKKIYENEFFNALQVKFAYAVTCHKAQGGQWKKVYVDVGQVPQEQIDKNYYRWFYTALTRASEQVVLVNFPEK